MSQPTAVSLLPIESAHERQSDHFTPKGSVSAPSVWDSFEQFFRSMAR